MTIYVCKACGIFFNPELEKCPDCGTKVPKNVGRTSGLYRKQFCWVHGNYIGLSGCPVCNQVPRPKLVVEK